MTPSMPPASTIASSESKTLALVEGRLSRVCAAGSAMATTLTASDSEMAWRWLRPIRPAPARPNLKTATVLEAPGAQEFAVRALIASRRAERIVGVWQHVLLDHEPALVAVVPQRVENRVHVEV